MIAEGFTPPNPLNTPVLFLVFNRLDTTKLVFQAIRTAKPPKLYIAADGARENKEGETEKVKAVREFILHNINWECEVKTLFRNENLGCKYAVSEAVDWFFNNEEMGIILEDDCLPSQSFFWFCEELLVKYKDDMRVWHISGDNFQSGLIRGDGDYYFSKYNHIWGWATWSNRWDYYDVEMKSFSRFNKEGLIKSIFYKNDTKKYWSAIFTRVSQGKIDTWDYQWTYTALCNNGLSITPNKNLISNIGFGPEATHTFDLGSPQSVLESEEVSFPLKHPSFMMIDVYADNLTASIMFTKRSFLAKVLNRITRAFK